MSKGQFRANYNPAPKRVFTAPPTPEMRQKAVEVIRRNAETIEQFKQDIEMLDLQDLVTV